MRESERGLLGIGRVGQWIVDLDEMPDDEYQLTISHPRVYAQLPSMTEGQLRTFQQALEDRRSGALGRMFRAEFLVEFSEGRGCFRILDGSVLLELSVDEAELTELTTALREAYVEGGLES